MSSNSELLQSGIQTHVAGNIEQARQIYRQVLERDPQNAQALNLLGLLGWQTGQFAEAAEHLRKAIEIDNSQAAFYANLAEAQRGLGQINEAIENYKRAVRLQPSAPVAHVHLAALYEQAGLADEAIASYERALRLEPNRADALTRVARIYAQQGDLAAAENCCRRAVQVQPALAALHFDLANILQMQGRLDDAADCYRKAIELQPEYAEAHCNLGNALRELGQPAAAHEHLQRAVALRPELAPARSNLGAVLQTLGRLDEARACFELALEQEPERFEYLHNLGTVLKDQGKVEEALKMYERALQSRPGYSQALCSRGTALLSLGRLAEGLADYEHRVECPQFNTLRLSQPRWDGAPLSDRRLLVHGEQGFGDVIQFIRYLPLARARATNVVVAVEAALIPLLEQSGYGPLVPKEEALPPFDVHAPLMSLPHIFGTELHNVPADVPYLAADDKRVAKWRAALEQYPGRKIGIAWQGRPMFRGDSMRSIPLSNYEPLARVEGVHLLSLQKAFGIEQIAQVAGRFEVVDLAASLDVGGAPFLDIAAVMKSLDLVITSDTAVAHVAGALGVPVWVALSYAPDWRWMVDRDDSPWYPSMRLFRQTQLGRWSDVFERMAEQLQSTSQP